MIPLSKIYRTGNEKKEIEKVIDSGWWAGCGPATNRLEESIADFLDIEKERVCVVDNCTNALILCLLYYNFQYGDVIVPSYSHVASAFSIIHAGLNPIFVDIDVNGVNLFGNNVEESINHHTKAIIAVHQYGIPYDIDEINRIAKRSDLNVIEDAACALGSRSNSIKIGKSKNFVCFSLHARKSITCGEGGVIVVPRGCDDGWFRSMRSFGIVSTPFFQHGKKEYKKPEFVKLGYNMRLSDIQAAVAIAQLEAIDEQLDKRNWLAKKYIQLLKDIDEISCLRVHEYIYSTWQTFRILVRDIVERNELIIHLRRNEIMARECTQPIHLEPVIKRRMEDFKFIIPHLCPNTVDVSRRGIWLPFYTDMSVHEIKQICDCIKDFYSGKK